MSSKIINLNDTSPAAPTGDINVKWQVGASSGTDPDTGLPVYPVSAHVPQGMTNPMTAAGDVIVGGASGAPARLAAGASGTVLTSNGSGTAPSWQASGGGGAGILVGTVDPTSFNVAQSKLQTGLGPIVFPSNTVAGNLLLLSLGSEGSIASVTVTDTQGNTWTQAVIESGTLTHASIWYAIAGASSANTVTIAGGTASFAWCGVVEVSGVATPSPLDATATAYTSASPATANVTTTSGSEFVFAVAQADHSATSFSAGTGMAIIKTANGSDAFVMGFMQTQAPGTYAPSFIVAGGADNVAFACATFKPSGPTIGTDGQLYLNVAKKTFWGPRTSGYWNIIGTLN